MTYTTTIRRVPCWHGMTGYQAELIRRNRKGTNIIEGAIWERRAKAEKDAARLLDAAPELFEAYDEQGA